MTGRCIDDVWSIAVPTASSVALIASLVSREMNLWSCACPTHRCSILGVAAFSKKGLLPMLSSSVECIALK